MPLRERPWFPYASAALWGLAVLALVLVNSGSVVLAIALALVVAAISYRVDGARRQ